MGNYRKLLDILPSALVSRAFGAISSIQLPASIQHLVNHGFAALAHIDVKEAALDINDYPSLEALFTRELKPGSRPVCEADLISPVDGTISFM